MTKIETAITVVTEALKSCPNTLHNFRTFHETFADKCLEAKLTDTNIWKAMKLLSEDGKIEKVKQGRVDMYFFSPEIGAEVLSDEVEESCVEVETEGDEVDCEEVDFVKTVDSNIEVFEEFESDEDEEFGLILDAYGI
jgi:hypothetical protein